MGEWALILGASSGFGEAMSLALANTGLSILGVHLDRKATLPHVHHIISEIEVTGRRAVFFNMNAADEEKRKEMLDRAERVLQEEGGGRYSRPHAFPRVREGQAYISEQAEEAITEGQMEMTLEVMAHSLVYWVQDLLARKLMGRGGRIYAMTSAGSTRIFPTYGAVSAAKATLESRIRQLAFELAPQGSPLMRFAQA